MKNLFLSLAFMLIGSFAFASNSIENPTKVEPASKTSCTVTVEFGGTTITVTTSCTCTQREACDIAFKSAARLIAGPSN